MVLRRKSQVFASENFVAFGGICGEKLGFLGLSSEGEHSGCMYMGHGEMPPEPENTAWGLPPSIGDLEHRGWFISGDRALGSRIW